MEDSNFYSIDLMKSSELKIDIFAIFDGHNGDEISKYISKNFKKELLSNPSFKSGDYIKSLKETFIRIDKSLQTEKVENELQKISLENQENINMNNLNFRYLEKLSEKEKEQINCIKDIINPKNLSNHTISSFSGCSGIVILITNTKIYVAKAGNCFFIPIDENLEIKREKMPHLHIFDTEEEKNRIINSNSFKDKERK